MASQTVEIEPFPLAEMLAAFTPTWHDRAACIDSNTDDYFPDRGYETPTRCAGCPVADECLAEGLGVEHGIWGGVRPTPRRKLRKAARQLDTTDPHEIAAALNVGPHTARALIELR